MLSAISDIKAKNRKKLSNYKYIIITIILLSLCAVKISLPNAAEAGVLLDNYDNIMQDISDAGIEVNAPEQEIKDWLVEMERFMSMFIINSSNVGDTVENGIINTLYIKYKDGPNAGQYKFPNLRDAFFNASQEELLEKAEHVAVEIRQLILSETIAISSPPPDIIYYVPVDVGLKTITSDAQIYYTLDGSTPTNGSNLYSGPVRIEKTTTIKAIAYKTGTKGGTTDVGSFEYHIGPQVQSYEPQGSSVSLAGEINISAVFSKDMIWNNSNEQFTVCDDTGHNITGSITYEQAEKKLVFTPQETLKSNTKYKVEISKEILDNEGIPLQSDFTWEFTTAPLILQLLQFKEAVALGDQVILHGIITSGLQALIGENITLQLTDPEETTSSYSIASGQNGEFDFVSSSAANKTGIYNIILSARGEVLANASYEVVDTAPPFVSHTPGLYYNDVPVKMQSNVSGALIFYTINGSDPRVNGISNDEVNITQGCILKAVINKKGVWGEVGEYEYKIGPRLLTDQSSPAEGAINVSVSAFVSVSFSRDIDEASLGLQNLSLFDSSGEAVEGTVEYDRITRTAVFKPERRLIPAQNYQVRISKEIKGLDGSPLENDYVWSFLTENSYVASLQVSGDSPEGFYVDDSLPVNHFVVSAYNQNGDPERLENTEVVWQSLNPGVIDVDEVSGQLIAKGGGEAELYAQLKSNSQVKSEVVIIHVLFPVKILEKKLVDLVGHEVSTPKAKGIYSLVTTLQSERDRMSPLLVMQIRDPHGEVVKLFSARTSLQPGVEAKLEAGARFTMPETTGVYTAEIYVWNKWLSELASDEWHESYASTEKFQF